MTQTGPLPDPLPKGEGEKPFSLRFRRPQTQTKKSMPQNASFAFRFPTTSSQPATHNVMQTNQAHTQSIAIDNGQHVDLRRPIFHQPQRIKSQHLRIRNNRIARPQMVAFDVREAEVGTADALQRSPRIAVSDNALQTAPITDTMNG